MTSAPGAPIRVFGVVIANGFASESRVFAQLVHGAGPALDVRTFVHESASARHPNDVAAAKQFAEASGARVVTADAGWRRTEGRRRSPIDKAINSLRLGVALPRVLIAARAHRPDLVYSSQQRWDAAVAALVARILRRPHVVHLHYNVGPWLGRGSIRRVERAAGVVCVSEFIAAQTARLGIEPSRVAAIPNAVRPTAGTAVTPIDRASLGLCVDDFVFLFVARLVPGKGHAEALLALAETTRRAPSARLVVVGDGPEAPGLAELAGSLGIADRVRFVGYRADVDRLLAMGDAFVHPSRREPFGLSILEASCAGLPTIAYREGGPMDIVDDGVNGILVPPPDVRGLADAMVRLASDREAARRMGRAAAASARDRFAPDRVAVRFVDQLGRWLGRAPLAIPSTPDEG